MSVELWKSIFDWSTVILIALTVVSGAGALITGDIINKRQDNRLHQFDRGLTDAKLELGKQQERAASAERMAEDARGKAGEAEERAGKANERAAALEVEALKLRRQLLSQGPRGNLLAGENRHRLVDALKPFSGQKIDIRHSASTIMVNGEVVMSTPIGDDVVGLANALVGVFKDAGWDLPPTPLPSGFQGDGVQVEILPNSSHETRAAATGLVEALRQVPIGVDGPIQITEVRAKRVGKEVIVPALDDNTIILLVLAHP